MSQWQFAYGIGLLAGSADSWCPQVNSAWESVLLFVHPIPPYS